jgi:hypothetical protein
MKVTLADPSKWGISADSATGRKLSVGLYDSVSTRSSSILGGGQEDLRPRASVNLALARRRSSFHNVQQAIIEEETVAEDDDGQEEKEHANIDKSDVVEAEGEGERVGADVTSVSSHENTNNNAEMDSLSASSKATARKRQSKILKYQWKLMLASYLRLTSKECKLIGLALPESVFAPLLDVSREASHSDSNSNSGSQLDPDGSEELASTFEAADSSNTLATAQHYSDFSDHLDDDITETHFMNVPALFIAYCYVTNAQVFCTIETHTNIHTHISFLIFFSEVI